MDENSQRVRPTVATVAGGVPVPRRPATMPVSSGSGSGSAADAASLPVGLAQTGTNTGAEAARPAAGVSVHDLAAYILAKLGRMTAMKLQKLAYYSQAWSLVWDERPLFSERVEAWANGPVVPPLYDRHRGLFEVGPPWSLGDPAALSRANQDTVEAVLSFYGHRTSQWLSDLTHQEAPWRDARAGLAPGERSNREITHAALAEYYGSL